MMVWPTELVVLDEKSRPQLAEQAELLSRWSADHQNAVLKDVAYSINTRPLSGNYRLAIVAQSMDDLARKLSYTANRLRQPECKRINERNGIYYADAPLGPGNH